MTDLSKPPTLPEPPSEESLAPKTPPSSDEEAALGPPIEEWERRLGRVLAIVFLSVFIAAIVLAMFFSILQQVTASPQVALPPREGGKILRLSRLHSCVARLRRMDQELEQESKNIWYRLRHKNRHHLSAWLDWSQDWRTRMDTLMKQCPLRGKSGIPRGFQRASESMLELQRRQEKAFRSFYTDSAWLFREIREGLHMLQEELR